VLLPGSPFGTDRNARSPFFTSSQRDGKQRPLQATTTERSTAKVISATDDGEIEHEMTLEVKTIKFPEE
jgi:hypothetical protein